MNWQPIETAPKDGKSILLFTRSGVIEGYFKRGYWEQGVIYSNYDMSGTYFDTLPTHWMPLPPEPTE